MAAAVRRRALDELGIDVSPELLFKFQYQAAFADHGTEFELCSVFLGRAADDRASTPPKSPTGAGRTRATSTASSPSRRSCSRLGSSSNGAACERSSAATSRRRVVESVGGRPPGPAPGTSAKRSGGRLHALHFLRWTLCSADDCGVARATEHSKPCWEGTHEAFGATASHVLGDADVR